MKAITARRRPGTVVGPESLSLHMWPCQVQEGPCSPGLLGRMLGCDQISSGAPEHRAVKGSVRNKAGAGCREGSQSQL